MQIIDVNIIVIYNTLCVGFRVLLEGRVFEEHFALRALFGEKYPPRKRKWGKKRAKARHFEKQNAHIFRRAKHLLIILAFHFPNCLTFCRGEIDYSYKIM